MAQVVPVVALSANIEDLINDIQSSNQFSQYFIALDNSVQWEDRLVLTSPSKIIPFQFLKSDPEARMVLKDYLISAQQYQHRIALERFESVMESSQLKAGKRLC